MNQTCHRHAPPSFTGLHPVALTIAGSDSGGGAGIQADLQTFAAAGVFGTSAITCVTAQNPDKVSGIYPLEPAMVIAQMEAVLDAFPVCAVKTGMLYGADIITAVAGAISRFRPPILVVDPVMVAGSGARLMRDDAVDALLHCLLPLAGVVTPNIAEAEILAGMEIKDDAKQIRAAVVIAERWKIACVVKGGHLTGGDRLTNVIALGDRVETWHVARVKTGKTHGTGCTFAAAITAAMALGADVFEAAARAGRAVTEALNAGFAAGAHYPLNWQAMKSLQGDCAKLPDVAPMKT